MRSRVELWVEERDGAPAVNPVMAGLLRLLQDDGLHPRVVVPEQRDLAPSRADLVLLKTSTPFALAAAAVTAAAGVAVLNDPAATAGVQDKAAGVAVLAAHGVPVPRTWLRGTLPEDAAAGEPAGAWVGKPVLGLHGHGVRTTGREPAPDDPAGSDRAGTLVQARVGGTEPDVKVYAVRDTLFAGRKPFSATSFRSDEVEPVTLSRAQRDVAVAAGEAAGLTVYGVDLRGDAGRPVVIDLNAFPGFRGFPQAAAVLAAQVRRALRTGTGAGLAHDVNGRLTALLGEIELVLARDDVPPAERAASATRAVDAVLQVRDLLRAGAA